jgi:hypothetical protein
MTSEGFKEALKAIQKSELAAYPRGCGKGRPVESRNPNAVLTGHRTRL